MSRFVVLGSIAVASFALGAVVNGVQSQTASEPCVVAERAAGTPAAAGLQFSGEGGRQVTESFTLPEGTVIYSFDMSGADYNSLDLMPAPRSAADGGGLLESENGAVSGAGATDIYAGGEFILEVVAAGPWSVSFEY